MPEITPKEAPKDEEDFIYEGLHADYPGMEDEAPDDFYEAVRRTDFADMDPKDYHEALRRAYLPPEMLKPKGPNIHPHAQVANVVGKVGGGILQGIKEGFTSAPLAISGALGSLGMEKPREEMEQVGFQDLIGRGYSPEIAQHVMKQRLETQQSLAGAELQTGQEGQAQAVEGAANYISTGVGLGLDGFVLENLAKKGMGDLAKHAISGAAGVGSYEAIKAWGEEKSASEIFNAALKGTGVGAIAGPVIAKVLKPVMNVGKGIARYIEEQGTARATAQVRALAAQADRFADSFKSDWLRTRFNSSPALQDPSVDPTLVAASLIHEVLGADVAEHASESAVAKMAESIRLQRNINQTLALGVPFEPPLEPIPGMEGIQSNAIPYSGGISPREALDNIIAQGKIQQQMTSMVPGVEGGMAPMPNQVDVGPAPGIEGMPQQQMMEGHVPGGMPGSQPIPGNMPLTTGQQEIFAPGQQQLFGADQSVPFNNTARVPIPPVQGPIPTGTPGQQPLFMPESQGQTELFGGEVAPGAKKKVIPAKRPRKGPKWLESARKKAGKEIGAFPEEDLTPRDARGEFTPEFFAELRRLRDKGMSLADARNQIREKGVKPQAIPPSKERLKEDEAATDQLNEMKRQLDKALEERVKKGFDKKLKPITEEQTSKIEKTLPASVKKHIPPPELKALLNLAKFIFNEEEQLNYKLSERVVPKEIKGDRVPPVMYSKNKSSMYTQTDNKFVPTGKPLEYKVRPTKEGIVINPQQIVKNSKGVPIDTPIEDRLKFVLGHELGHATGNEDRLARRTLRNYKSRGGYLFNRAAILEEAIADAVGESLSGVKRAATISSDLNYPQPKNESERRYVAKKVAEALLTAREMLLDTPIGDK